jgi:hypothetical protein
MRNDNNVDIYNKPLRTQAMIEIRRRVVEGQTYEQIMRDLHLPERTFFRCLNAVFEKDRKQMDQVNSEEVMNQIVILRDRLSRIYGECQGIAQDKEVDGYARVKALHLAAEISVAIVKLHREVPAKPAANKELPYTMRELRQQHHQQQERQQFDNDSEEDDEKEDYDEEYEQDDDPQKEEQELSPSHRGICKEVKTDGITTIRR